MQRSNHLTSFILLTVLLLSCPLINTAQNVTIQGSIKIQEGAQDGYILKSDANGVGIWSPSETITRKQNFVTDFGAKGDGTTEDAPAFQAAINAAAIQGGTVHIPVGNYKISQTLLVPAGVQLQGMGLGNSITPNAQTTTGSRISFYGVNQFAMIFSGDYVACNNLSVVDAGGQASGGIHYEVKNSTFGIGATFNNLFLYNFTNGTSLKLSAVGASGIGWCSFENIHIRHAKKGIHIEVAEDGSFINLVTFRSIAIAGAGFDYGLLVDGPLSTTDWYGVSMNADCPSVGHIVLDTKGYVNIYGIQINSAVSTCESNLIHLKEGTRGSYIHGNTGKGRIIDDGSNFIDVQGTHSIAARPAGNNLLQNAAFKGLVDSDLPHWKFETCTGCSAPDALVTSTAEWKDNHNVLKITVGAGKTAHLSQEGRYFTKAYQYKECLFGAMIKTTATDVEVRPYFQTCGGGGSTAGSAHPNDGKWHYIGKTAELDSDPNCQPDPRFVIDNSAGGSAAEVYITTPSFVFNRGVKPSLEAAPITSAGGIMNGTLSTSMLEIASPASNQLMVAPDANLFQISGTNAIHSINLTTTIFPKGTLLTLLFEENGLEVVHATNSIKLLGSQNYVSEAYSALKLAALGDGTWIEVDRNCEGNCQTSTLEETETSPTNAVIEVTKINSKTATQTAMDVSIYPNPTQYGVHIDFAKWQQNQQYTLQIIDANARILLQTTIHNATNWVDFSPYNLVAGKYYLQLLDSKGEIVYGNGLIVNGKF